MEQVNDEITKEFNDKIKDIEQIDESKKKMINTLCYTIAIIMFICVLVGTIISINNYLAAKKQQEERNNIPGITFKKVN